MFHIKKSSVISIHLRDDTLQTVEPRSAEGDNLILTGFLGEVP